MIDQPFTPQTAIRRFPADEQNVVEKGFHPEFQAQLETMMAVGNVYLGMRGSRRRAAPMPKTPPHQ